MKNIDTSKKLKDAQATHVLDLSDLGLDTVPESVENLTQLDRLYLQANHLTQLPDYITELTRLQVLRLAGNKLTRLPESLGQLSDLRELHASNNRLLSIPRSIGQLTELRILRLSTNQLSSLPQEFSKLHGLSALHLSNNKIATLPSSICHLIGLRTLQLGNNKLTELPEEMGQLTNLKALYLTQNRLSRLPQSIGRLSQLRALYVWNNRLTVLPDSIGQLMLLEELYLADNELTALPDSIHELRNLKELYLHGNPALGLPKEVLGPSWQQVQDDRAQPAKPAEILEYYRKLRHGRRPLNEAKLILVGRGGVGKTSVVNRLVHDRFERDEKKTEGIRITEWKLHLNSADGVRLNIWDFGGQEIMHATHQFFLTDRSLYLLVLQGREGGEDADAEYWLKLIESFGGESPIIVVLNKSREHPCDVNRRALKGKYSIRDFIKTDCEDGFGIEELRESIKRETDYLENLRDPFPASWFTIKEQLAGMKRTYLSFDEYRKFCNKHGEKDERAQAVLAGYLHNLGIILNYKDDPRLQDTHVLNPHWVTNGIYRILNAAKLERQNGEIYLNELSEILDSGEYPVNMRRFIFDLMKKFELCFSFPDDDTHYLIPELLDKQEPVEAEEFKLQECLNFQYHYPILPEGLLPRFIVRTHVLSDGLPRWRTGVILKFEGNQALVKAEPQDRKVFICISGPIASRRRLLAIIRSDFERIHSDIRNLQPQEMVPLPGLPEAVVPYRELLIMEQNGVKKFPKVIGNSIEKLDINGLLNGVDLDGTRRTGAMVEDQTPVVRLFYSYSHKDEVLRNELETHLKLLQRQGLIEVWHDRKISAGSEWKHQIDDNLDRANLILLLVSPDFIASDYCFDKEWEVALAKHQAGTARVVPIILRDTDWLPSKLAMLQALPTDGRPVTKWRPRDSAWRVIAEELREVVEEVREQGSL